MMMSNIRTYTENVAYVCVFNAIIMMFAFDLPLGPYMLGTCVCVSR